MPGFNGLRVLSFESRRAQEIAQLIRNNGGEPIVAPALREVHTPNTDEERLIRGILHQEFTAIIFMTGIGARALLESAADVCPREEFLTALKKSRVIVRGPKPTAVMRDFGVPIALTAPEPNTWREIVAVLDENPEKVPLRDSRIGIQEHGEPSLELYAALRERGAEVFAAPVYRWELPEDIGPLKNAIRAVIEHQVDVALFTSSAQYVHAEKVAAEMGLLGEFKQALNKTIVASIGPIASKTLRDNGIHIDIEPTHPRMGFLVKEAAEKSGEVRRSQTSA